VVPVSWGKWVVGTVVEVVVTGGSVVAGAGTVVGSRLVVVVAGMVVVVVLGLVVVVVSGTRWKPDGTVLVDPPELADPESFVLTVSHSTPSPTNSTAMTAVDRRSGIRFETGPRTTRSQRVSFTFRPRRWRGEA